MRRLRISVPIVLFILALLGAFIPRPALAAPVLTAIVPSSGPAGTIVNLAGTGFTASTAETIGWDGVPFTTTTTSPAGDLAVTFAVPLTVAGAHGIIVLTPDTSNILTFTVTPSIMLSATSVQAGNSVSINGTGYAASLAVTIYIDGDTSTTATTTSSATGSFSTSFTVPSGAGGTHTVTATDAAFNTSSATYTVASGVTVTPASVAVGTQFTISGSAFAASSAITITVDGVNLTTATTNAAGSFTVSLAAPAKPIGVHTIRAVDAASHSATTTYTVISSMTVTPSSFTSGSQIAISGAGFAALSAIVAYVDGNVIQSNIATTNANGSFTISSLSVPKLPGGNHTLQVRDASSNTATVNFSVVQGVTASSQTGAAGTGVQISGSGFGVSKVITITFGSTKLTTSPEVITTDASGGFTATYSVPPSSGGSHTVIITDGTISATSTFTVTASANISAVSGTVGSSATVTGTSFGSGANVLITYDGQSVMTAKADNAGAFSAAFTVPASVTGAHTVEASDGTRKISFSFTVAAKASISPASGNVGTPITVTGDGFKSNGEIAIKYNDIQIGGVTANVTGGWAAVFQAPVSKGGNHTVIITDGTSTVTTAFAMDSTPPSAPTSIAPIDDTKADALTTFKWGEVTDPSGLTYELEVSRHSDFSILVIEKRGLTARGYQVTELEELESVSQQEPYYWRVRAIDTASNVGAWSQTQTFYVGFVLPMWGFWTIIGGAVALSFVLGYLLGKRRRWY